MFLGFIQTFLEAQCSDHAMHSKYGYFPCVYTNNVISVIYHKRANSNENKC